MPLDPERIATIEKAVKSIDGRFDAHCRRRADAQLEHSKLPWKRTDSSHPDVGKTHKQLAARYRRGAEADRRGSGRKPMPGHAHGEPDKFSFRSAGAQQAIAEWHEKQAAAGKRFMEEKDLADRPDYHQLMRGDAGVGEYVRDKVGKFAKSAGATAKYAAGRVSRGIGNWKDRRSISHNKKELEWAKGGEKDIRRMAKRGKTGGIFGEYVKPGYWAGEAKKRQGNIKAAEQRIKNRGDTRGDLDPATLALGTVAAGVAGHHLYHAARDKIRSASANHAVRKATRAAEKIPDTLAHSNLQQRNRQLTGQKATSASAAAHTPQSRFNASRSLIAQSKRDDASIRQAIGAVDRHLKQAGKRAPMSNRQFREWAGSTAKKI